MKFLVMLSLSLVAASAMACPDLAGTYQCQKDSNDPNDSGVISFANSTQGYILTDKDDPSKPSLLPADGKTYTGNDGSTYVGTCTDTFNIVETGNDPQYGPVKVNMKIHLDDSKNLVQEGVFNIQGTDYPFTETCTRM